MEYRGIAIAATLSAHIVTIYPFSFVFFTSMEYIEFFGTDDYFIKEETMMMNRMDAKQVVTMLERISWNVLLQCEGLPESMLHWTPPFPYSSSLFSLAVHILEDMEWRILRPLRSNISKNEQEITISSPHTFSDLKACYTQTIQHINSTINILTCSESEHTITSSHREEKNMLSSTLPVSTCLLTALERSAVLLGQMQLLRQLYDAGEHEYQQITASLID